MKGHLRKRSQGWVSVIDLGQQTCRQCPKCPKAKRYWHDGPPAPAQCPRCGGSLLPTTARRQSWSPSFETKAAAQDDLNVRLVRLRQGSLVPRSTQTVAQYLLDEWLPTKKPIDESAGRLHRGRLSPSTYDQYQTYLRAYVGPAIGHLRLDELRTPSLDQLFDHLERRGGRKGKGLSHKTLQNLHGLLSKAFGDAVRRGRLEKNPMEAVARPAARTTPMTIWSPGELRRFLSVAEDDDLHAAWSLFALTGMRRAEVAGLTWDRVDLEAGCLWVEWTLSTIQGQPIWREMPKTKSSRRRVFLPEMVIDALRRHRHAQSAAKLRAGSAWTPLAVDGFGHGAERGVFLDNVGRVVRPDRYSRGIHRLADAAGLPHIRLHDLRHSYATAALANATTPNDFKVISERLGHSSVAFTLDRYAQALPASQRSVSDDVAKAIMGS